MARGDHPAPCLFRTGQGVVSPPSWLRPSVIMKLMVTDTAMRQALRRMLPELRARYGVRRLYVFGSRARGDAHPDSDLDLLIEFTHTPTFFDLVRLENELSSELGVRVQVVTGGAYKPAVNSMAKHNLVNVQGWASFTDARSEVVNHGAGLLKQPLSPGPS